MAEPGLGQALAPNHWSFQIQVPLGAVTLPHEMVSDLVKPHEEERGQTCPKAASHLPHTLQVEEVGPMASSQQCLSPMMALVQPRKPPVHSVSGLRLQPSPDLQRLLAWEASLVFQQGLGTPTVCKLQAGGPSLLPGAVKHPPRGSHGLAFTGSFHLSLNIHPISHTNYITF